MPGSSLHERIITTPQEKDKSSLIIENAHVDFTGRYTVKASNGIDNTEETFVIKVFGKSLKIFSSFLYTL